MSILTTILQFIRRHDKGRIDDYTTLRIVDRDSFKYKEGKRSLTFHVERLPSNPDWIIYSSSIERWDPPHDKFRIPDGRKNRIIQKVCRNFDEAGETYEVE